MIEDIKLLEEDFANNEYYGTNVWTDEKYRVLSGKGSVLLSAPHSVNQIRYDDVRDAEKYTGAIVRYLSRATNSYAIFQLFTHADPNNDEEHNYKNAIINLIEINKIKLLIDVHSSVFRDDADIDLVTNNGESMCGNFELLNKLKVLGIKYGLDIAENNTPNKEKKYEIIRVSSLVCGIPSIRLVINRNKLDRNDNEAFLKKILMLLEEFISYVDYN